MLLVAGVCQCRMRLALFACLLFIKTAYVVAQFLRATDHLEGATIMSEEETKQVVGNATTLLTLGSWHRAFEMLEVASVNGSGAYATESIFQLARLQEGGCGASSYSKDGKCPLVQNHGSALRLYAMAANLGHPGAQLAISVALSSGAFVLGYSRELEVLQSYTQHKGNASVEDVAVIHEYFAAVGEEPLAMMALGWRHIHGYGVPANCGVGLEYYQASADASIVTILRDGIPRPNDRVQLSEQTRALQRNRVIYVSTAITTKIWSYVVYVCVQVKAILRMMILPRKANAVKNSAGELHRRRADGVSVTKRHGQYAPTTTQLTYLVDDEFWGVGGSPYAGSDVLRYYRYAAEQGDTQAQLAIGHFHYFGTRGVKQNLSTAVSFFQRAARRGDPSAASWFGHMLAHGLGVNKSEISALGWLRIGEAAGDAVALNTLGLLRLRGVQNIDAFEVQPRSIHSSMATSTAGFRPTTGQISQLSEASAAAHVEEASKYFQLASEKGNSDALYNLGMLELGWDGREESEFAILLNSVARGNYNRDSGSFSFQSQRPARFQAHKALQLLSLAAQSGHIRAYHIVAKMYASGVGVASSCEVAASAYKVVAERGPWILALSHGHALYRMGDAMAARRQYAKLSHAGYEVAQANAAWLLEILATDASFLVKAPDKRDDSNGMSYMCSCDSLDGSSCDRRALLLYKRAAQQGSAEATVKLGDMYYSGRGVNVRDLQSTRRLQEYSERTGDTGATTLRGRETAVAYYRTAHALKSARAAFNVGWCYQRGTGVAQRDFNLAKRHYVQASTMAIEAAWPTRIALWCLQAEWAFSISFSYSSRVYRLLRVLRDLIVFVVAIQHSKTPLVSHDTLSVFFLFATAVSILRTRRASARTLSTLCSQPV
mmetsp:Transcript_10489/g.31609  ORF Transcript_10489/g.31609 Transcript_10489/m.31609 type:complete len:889 (-) Transcript_10489:246-2912(-)